MIDDVVAVGGRRARRVLGGAALVVVLWTLGFRLRGAAAGRACSCSPATATTTG